MQPLAILDGAIDRTDEGRPPLTSVLATVVGPFDLHPLTRDQVPVAPSCDILVVNKSNAVSTGDLHRSPALLTMPERDDSLCHTGEFRTLPLGDGTHFFADYWLRLRCSHEL